MLEYNSASTLKKATIIKLIEYRQVQDGVEKKKSRLSDYVSNKVKIMSTFENSH